VHGRHAVLGAVGGHPEDLERTEVRGDEREPGDPGGQRTARQEEIEVRLDEAASQEPHSEDRHEVERDDHVVERARVDPQHCAPLPGLRRTAGLPLRSHGDLIRSSGVDRRLANKNIRTGLIAGAVALVVFALAWVVGLVY
jgi:hypothetical protein